MRRLLSIILLVLLFTSVYSQTNNSSVADQISSAELSKSDIISKSRRLILQKMQKNDKAAVEEIMDYLANNVDDEDHLSLWIVERWLLCYWTGNYSQILNSVLYLNALGSSSASPKTSVVPPDDIIALKVEERVLNEFDSIVDDFDSMDFSDDSKDFLYLLLCKLMLFYHEDFVTMDDINTISDDFIKNYPDSPLKKVVRENISYKLGIGDWGWGIALGGGFVFDSGNIKNYIDQSGGITMNLDVYYKRFYFGFSMMGSFGKVIKDIPIKDKGRTWYAGDQIPVTVLTPVFGFTALEYKRLRFIPFGGVSFDIATPSDDDKDDNPDMKGLSLGTSVVPMLGFNADIALNNPRKISASSSLPGAIYSLGVKAFYQPDIITTQGKMLDGRLFFLGFTLKAYFYQVKHVF